MEKIAYVLWRDPHVSAQEFRHYLRTEVADKLLALGARGVQVNVADDAVLPAAGLRQVTTRPQMDGVLWLWVDSAINQFREPFDNVISAAIARVAGYLVTESQPILNTRHPAKPGERTAGFSQLAFLKRPPCLTPEAWLDTWHNSHTQIAIDTQDNFQYVQNVVVRPLTYAAPVYDAIVEECFPSDAMNNQHAFYNAVGDDAKFQRHLQTMIDSCQRFIDFDKIDVVPTSQYVIKSPFA